MSHRIPAAVQAVVDGRDKHVDRLTARGITRGRNLHHRKLLSRGGLDTAGNIVTLSGSGTTGSHGWVHANPARATDIGLMLPSWITDPSAVPVKLTNRYGRRQWYRLTDDGEQIELPERLAGVVMFDLGLWPDPDPYARTHSND